MDLPDELVVFHQPARLRIMGLLYKQRDASFTRVRDLLGLTDGNLASHGKRLADAGHVEMRRVLTRDGFESRLRITRAGARAFRAYLLVLRRFVDEHDGRGTDGSSSEVGAAHDASSPHDPDPTAP